MKKIIIIIIAIIICGGGITAVVINNNNNKKNEPVTSSNQISSSDNQVSKTSINDEEIEELIEKYTKAINNRNVDDIMNMYDIDGINEYTKEVSNSDKTTSKSDLINLINKEIEYLENLEVTFKLSKFYIVHDISDIEEMNKGMGSENPNISDEYKNELNNVIKKYTICFPYYIRTSNRSNDLDNGKEVPGQIVVNNNGKIVHDSIIVY